MPQSNSCVVNEQLPPKFYDKDLDTEVNYNFPFFFAAEEDVVVYRKNNDNDKPEDYDLLDNDATASADHYQITPNAKNQGGTVKFQVAPGGVRLIIGRRTNICKNDIEFQVGASIRAEDLNASQKQLLDLIQELRGSISAILGLDPDDPIIPEEPIYLDDLGDVVITGPVNNPSYLRWNGTDWVNAIVQTEAAVWVADDSRVPTTKATDDRYIGSGGAGKNIVDGFGTDVTDDGTNVQVDIVQSTFWGQNFPTTNIGDGAASTVNGNMTGVGDITFDGSQTVNTNPATDDITVDGTGDLIINRPTQANDEIDLRSGNDLKLSDGDNTNSVSLSAPANVTEDQVLTMPATGPTATERALVAGGNTTGAGTHALTWANNTPVTYTLESSANGTSIDLDLTGSNGVTDTVTIGAGANITFTSVTAGGFTINSTGGGGGGSGTVIDNCAALNTEAAKPPSNGDQFTVLDSANMTAAAGAAPGNTTAIHDLPETVAAGGPQGGYSDQISVVVQWDSTTVPLSPRWQYIRWYANNPDARYVEVSGDTMTGTLTIDNTTADENALVTGAGHDIVLGQGANVVFDGANGDGTLTTAALTADRTYTLPDASGTIALTTDITASLWEANGGNLRPITNTQGVQIRNGANNTTLLDATGAAHFNQNKANADFRVDGDANDNVLFVDASADRVGIGTNTPEALLDVNGNINVTNGNNVSHIINNDGSATFNDNKVAADFTIKSDLDAHMFFVDGSENHIGISEASPSQALDVRGNIQIADGNDLILENASENQRISINADDATASYTVTLPPTAPTANGQVMRVASGTADAELEWGVAAGSVAVEDDDASVVAAATTLNFTGDGVTVTDAGSGQADIAIASGGSDPQVSANGSPGFRRFPNRIENKITFASNNPAPPSYLTQGRGCIVNGGNNSGSMSARQSGYIDGNGTFRSWGLIDSGEALGNGANVTDGILANAVIPAINAIPQTEVALAGNAAYSNWLQKPANSMSGNTAGQAIPGFSANSELMPYNATAFQSVNCTDLMRCGLTENGAAYIWGSVAQGNTYGSTTAIRTARPVVSWTLPYTIRSTAWDGGAPDTAGTFNNIGTFSTTPSDGSGMEFDVTVNADLSFTVTISDQGTDDQDYAPGDTFVIDGATQLGGNPDLTIVLEWDRSGTPVQLVGTDRPQFTQFTTTNLSGTPTTSVPSFCVDTNGRLYSMGFNSYGNLASNTTGTANKSFMIRLPRGMFRRDGTSQSIRVVGGSRNDGCWGLTPNGDCFVWGRMISGNLGTGTANANVPIPVCLTEPGIADNAIANRKVQHVMMTTANRTTHFLLDNGTVAACGDGNNWGGSLGLPAASDGSGTATGTYANNINVLHPVLLDYTGAGQLNGSCQVFLDGALQTSSGNQKVVAMYSNGDTANRYTIAITDGGEKTDGTAAQNWARGDYPRAYGWGYNTSGAAITGLANRTNSGSATVISNWSIPTACKFYALQDLGQPDESTALNDDNANWLEVEQYSEEYFAKYGTNCKVDQVYPSPTVTDATQFTIFIMSNGKAFGSGRVNQNRNGTIWGIDNVTNNAPIETNYTSVGYYFGLCPYRFQPARVKDLTWLGDGNMGSTAVNPVASLVFMGYNNIPYQVSSGSNSNSARWSGALNWFVTTGSWNTANSAIPNTSMYLTAWFPGQLK